MIKENSIFYIQDTLRKNVEIQTEGAVTVLYDDAGIPSYMMRIPQFKVETIDTSLGRGIHPAFIVNGKEVPEIFVGQMNATIIDGRAYSLPDEKQYKNINFDDAREACTKKGKGWHLLNNWEYAALVMYIVKNRIKYFVKEWWDWLDGLKIVDGEIFTPKDNNFEQPETEWPSLGIFFDDIDGVPQLSKKITHYSEPDPKGAADDRNGNYAHLSNISKLEYAVSQEKSPDDFTETDIRPLAQLLIEPSAMPIISEINNPLYVYNYGERLPIRGGPMNHGGDGGLGTLYLTDRRSETHHSLGFRPAYLGI
jgi:hypothetical protein